MFVFQEAQGLDLDIKHRQLRLQHCNKVFAPILAHTSGGATLDSPFGNSQAFTLVAFAFASAKMAFVSIWGIDSRILCL